MIVIGSTATGIREPNDYDVMVHEFLEVKDYRKSTEETKSIDKIVVSKEIYDMLEHEDGVATLDCVYTIKCSHLFVDNKWWKTKHDILQLESMGCEIIKPLYYALIDYWMNVNPPKFNLSLNKSKEEFFTDKVTYVVDHDYLHELVAYPNRPVYERILKDGHEVLVDRNKFETLMFHEQVRMFREEITVIAIERWLINPHWHDKVSWLRAYQLSLKKTIISLTKNWARDFLIMNLKEFVKPDYDYFKHTLKTLEIYIMNGSELINEMMAVLGDDTYPRDEFISELLAEGYLSGDDEKKLTEAGFKYIKQEGGGEGGSEYCYSIFEWKGQAYKMEYSYYSHYGYDFDNAESSISEVTPIEKTVTVYQ